VTTRHHPRGDDEDRSVAGLGILFGFERAACLLRHTDLRARSTLRRWGTGVGTPVVVRNR
jgi:hypothetical protein